MSEEERQRQMDFILNSLFQLTAKVGGLADIERADAVRIGRLEEAFVTLTELSSRVVERLDEQNARVNNVEQAIVTLTKLVEQHNNSKGD